MAIDYLNKNGLSYFWNKIKTYAGNFACTAAKALGIHFVIPNETEQTATLTATITGVTSYFVGLTVALRMPFNTPASATLNINNLGAKPIYYKVNTTSANYYPANTVVLLVYETTTLNTGCFKMVYAYDSNTNNATAQNISTSNATYPVLIGATANATANIGNKATYFCKDVKINPSSGAFSANEITVNQASIKATVTDTDSTTTRTEQIFKANSSNSSYGINVMFGANSNTVIGAGEGKESQLSELAGTSNEHIYFVADSNIYFKSNANTYANAKVINYTAAGNLDYENPNATRGTNPSSVVERGIRWQDSAGNRLAVISNAYLTDSSSLTALYAYKTTVATGNSIGKLGIGCDASGNIYTIAPTPSSAADNTTKIATTAWVRTATGNFACNAATASAVAWSGVTSKPTTISGYGITDAKIANGTITLGSNSITPLTSVPSHNQASNTITAMTGYSKPSSTSAIATGDTLNQAIGKLEKAIDDADISNTVHLTGNEFVGGIKEFGNSYYDSTREGETDWESSSLIIRYQNYIKGSGAPSANKYANLLFLDKTGTNINWSGRLGSVENDVESDGTHKTLLVCYKNEVVDGVAAHDTVLVGVGYDSNGVKFAVAPSTSEDRTAASDILTRDWIPKDTRIVHTSGSETISGEKHFNNACIFHHPSIAKGTIPSSTSYRSLAFADNTSLNGAMDHRSGILENKIDTDGTTITYIGAYQWTSGSTNYATMGISIDRSGNASAYAPTPAASSNTTNIATTAWVRTFCTSNYAQLSSKNVFSQSQVISRVNPYLIFKETDIVKGTSSGSGWQGIKFFDNNYNTSTDGAGAEECGELIMSHGTTTEALYRFVVYKPAKNSTTYASLAFGYVGGNTDSYLYLLTNSHDNSIKLGSSSHRWSVVYAGTGSINTSDARLKSNISNISDSVLDAWSKVRWCQFKMNDAIAEKGDKARIHSGAIAQEIASVFESEGLDPSRYALYCYDKWEAREEKKDTFGSVKETAWSAGDRYSLRYEEALCVEAAYMRRENARLKKRVADLEDRLAALELRLGSE